MRCVRSCARVRRRRGIVRVHGGRAQRAQRCGGLTQRRKQRIAAGAGRVDLPAGGGPDDGAIGQFPGIPVDFLVQSELTSVEIEVLAGVTIDTHQRHVVHEERVPPRREMHSGL